MKKAGFTLYFQASSYPKSASTFWERAPSLPFVF
jgi:hypothetical protein